MHFDAQNRRDFLKRAALAAAATTMPAPSWSAVSARASALHRSAYVFDGHVHALDREFYHGGNITDRVDAGQWDLPRAKEGGVDAFFLSVYVPEEYYPGRYETKQALRRIDHALDQLQKANPQLGLAMNGRDLTRLQQEKRIAAVLDIEGSYDLDGDLDVLRALYQLGLRSAQISAHNWNQHYADSCCTTARWNGLTAHGHDVVREMNRLGMVINVSHSADTTMAQVIDASERPVIATHHGLRQVNDIPRNISDALLKKLVDHGGVIAFQIGSEFAYPREYAWVTAHRKKTFWDTTSIPERARGKTIYQIDELMAPTFPMVGAEVPDEVAMHIDDWVGVVDRAIKLVGEDAVALGSDFDGGPTLARGMRDVRDLPIITEAMLSRGYSEVRIRKFLGDNLCRVFSQATA